MNVKQTTEAIEIVKRVQEFLKSQAGSNVAEHIKSQSVVAVENTPEAKRYDQGFEDGFNAGLDMYGKISIDDLDISEVVEAVYPAEEKS